MLQRRKKNMFMSFRYEPRDLQNDFEQIQLNVRQGLANLQCDAKQTNNDNVTTITRQLNDVDIDEMTSIDYCNDLRTHYRTHEWRMRDIIYTKKLWKAICCNSHLFKDKIVIDVSCDMGILSMFSAIAGAKHVYAIDTSNIVQLTSRIIDDNKLSHKITVIKGKVMDISLPVDKVDIIVSTFFGQSLLCENRIDEVVDARNKWLKPDGLIFPNCANLYIAAMNNRLVTDRSNFWEHLYQFDMRPMIPAVNSEPYLQHVNLNQVVTNACPIKHINLYTVEKCDYRLFDAPFHLESGSNVHIGAFFTYFDIAFTEGIKPITFTIQPGWEHTYWSPMIFFLSINDFLVDEEEKFNGIFRFNGLSDDYRKIDWNIQMMHTGNHGKFHENWHFKTR